MAIPQRIDWTDESIFTEIENAVSDGADSATEIAEAIGLKYETLRGRMYPNKKCSVAFVEVTHKISAAIKKGRETRRQAMKASARRGLKKLIEGFETVDVLTEKKTTGVKPDGSGGTTTVYKRENRKQYAPNVTAVIFALCNTDSENYKSLYRAGEAVEDEATARRGLIAQWLQEQASQGAQHGAGAFPGVHDSGSTMGDS